MRTLKDLALKGRKVLMRVDFNVPMDDAGRITDDLRIRAALPSINYVLNQGGALILMSHLGRPKAVFDPKFSLAPIAKRLSELLVKPVKMAPAAIGPKVEEMAKGLASGQVLMLENVRFYKGEEDPPSDPIFAPSLAKLADFYVDDAFGSAHRAHASIVDVARLFPGKAAAGFLMQREIEELEKLVTSPKRPFYAIIGGAKISSKAGVLKKLLDRIDALFIGGGMAFTFLKSQGMEIGKSIYSEDDLSLAKEIFVLAHERKIPLRLPSDFVIADAFQNDAKRKVIYAKDNIPRDWFGMDIGPDTVKEWGALLKQGATIFWNGPLGVFEMPHFEAGTRGIAEALAHTSAYVVVGGGDSVAAVQKMGFTDSFSYLSTGGGASLEYLEYGHLPGQDCLS